MHQMKLDSAAKIAIQEHTQGNLLAASQVIERLKLIEPDLIDGSSLPLEKVLESLRKVLNILFTIS